MVETTSQRDPRIDFARGVCLLVIFSSHINPNYLKKPLSGWGFSDAAEVFVFLAGYVAGVVFHRVFVAEGLWACQLKAFKRCAQIYLAHLATMAVVLLMVQFWLTELDLRSIGAGLFLDNAEAALTRTALLAYSPAWFNVLPLFIPLLAAVPVMLWINARYGTYAMLALSAALYACVQCFPNDLVMPAFWQQAWYFNPWAWQFLFFVGVAIGTSPRWRQSVLPRKRALAIGAVLALVAIFAAKCTHTALRHPSFFEDLFAIFFQNAPRQIPSVPYAHQFPLTHKPNLEPLRLIHFFVLIYLMMAWVPRVSSFWTSRLATAFITCGRHSLTVFCGNIVLVYAANAMLTTYGQSLLVQTLFNFVGWGLLLAFGRGLERVRAAKKRAAPQSHDSISVEDAGSCQPDVVGLASSPGLLCGAGRGD